MNIKSKIFFLFLIAFSLSGCALETSSLYSEEDKVRCEIIKVIDGDTLSVRYEGEVNKVRLIGIDTPESVHVDETKNTEFGNLASEYTKELLEDVEYVYLEFDTAMYDDYDRILAYVYTSNNQTIEESINYILVSEGYALNKEFAPNTKYAEYFKAACENAEENQNGLWKLNNDL